jgi:hypothetical protein
MVKQHPLVAASRKRLLDMRGTGERAQVAKRAGITYRTVNAICQGKLREMVFSREVRLARAVGLDLRDYL